MALPTRADTFLHRRGEQINVYRRTASGTDEFNRPEYTWDLLYTLSIWTRWDIIKSKEEIYVAGERIVAEFKVFFQSDEDVLKDDQLLRGGSRYDIVAIQPKSISGSSHFKVAYVRRLLT